VGLALAACGGDDSTDQSAPPLEPAVEKWVATFWSGDGEGAFALLSERCKGLEGESDFVNVVEDFAHEGVEITSYSDEIDGSRATATYGLTDPSLDQTGEPWVLEKGVWRNDGC
jgi:hypothetical protein